MSLFKTQHHNLATKPTRKHAIKAKSGEIINTIYCNDYLIIAQLYF